MRQILTLNILIVIFLYPVLLKASSERITLDFAFQQALKKNEDLAIQHEKNLQTQENRTQAQGLFLPHLQSSASYLKQETPNNLQAAAIYPSNQPIAQFTLTQSIFKGFRDFSALKQATQLLEAGKLNQEQLKIQLYQNLVQIFYKILLYEQDIINFKNEIHLHEKRILKLKEWIRLGRNRQTEILLTQSNIASLEAQIEETIGLLKSTWTSFTLLTGLSSKQPLLEDKPFPKKEIHLENYLTQIESRPDILALKKSTEASESGIRIIQSEHYPSINFFGNYYLQRPGLLKHVNWDVQIGMTLPLFQGGITQSKVKQANLVHQQTQIELEKGRRVARQQIESLYQLFQSHYSQFEKQKKTVELKKQSYHAELEDYKLGLVNHLEVLQSLTLFQESQRILDQTQYQLKADYLCLLASAGFKFTSQKSKENQNIHSPHSTPIKGYP